MEDRINGRPRMTEAQRLAVTLCTVTYTLDYLAWCAARATATFTQFAVAASARDAPAPVAGGG